MNICNLKEQGLPALKLLRQKFLLELNAAIAFQADKTKSQVTLSYTDNEGDYCHLNFFKPHDVPEIVTAMEQLANRLAAQKMLVEQAISDLQSASVTTAQSN